MIRRTGRTALSLAVVATLAAGLPSRDRQIARPPASLPTLIRVDQSGYPDHGVKAAYVMAARALSGRAAVMTRSATTVATFPLGPSLGAWNAAYPHIYRVDFSPVTRDGVYVVAAGGVRSVSFRLGPAASVYEKDLAHALYFYENERDGPSYVPTPLRTAPGHLNDARAATYATPTVDSNGIFRGDLTPLGSTIDVAGGWWDAGDYLKFVETTSYVVALMLDGARTFPDQMGPGAATGAANFTGEARFGLDFLMRMWDEQTKTLYYQVGIGAGNASGTILSDHDIWRLPQVDDTYGGTDPTYKYIRHRPVFAAAPAAAPISPNLAGRLSADFGLCYQVFRSSNPMLADSCLRDGETVFGLAKTTRVGRLLTAIPYGFYPEATWQDDMEYGATELYRALVDGGSRVPGLAHTGASYYLRQAAGWASAYIKLGATKWRTLNLYDTAGLAHYELYTALGRAGDPPGLAVTRGQLLANLKDLIGIGVDQAAGSPFGNGAPWNNYDSVSLSDGLSVMASEYDALTHTATFAGQAQGWLDQNLGANPWGLALLVGDGTASPDCLSHQVANIVGNLHGGSPILDGAAVEGPNRAGVSGFVTGMRACSVSYRVFNSSLGVYVDNEQSYDTTEPAIDLTASSPLAFAWLTSSSR